MRACLNCTNILSDWEALFDRRAGHRVELLVRIPPHVPVGLWRLSVVTWYGEKSLSGQNGQNLSQIYHSEDPFYILFNPFNESKLPTYLPTYLHAFSVCVSVYFIGVDVINKF